VRLMTTPPDEKAIAFNTDRPKNHIIMKFVLVFVAVACVSMLLYQLDCVQVFLKKDRLIQFLDTFGPWSFAGFILLQAVQVIVAPIPGDVTGFLGGFLYGPYLGLILSTVGLTLGSYAAFVLSRVFGRPFVEKFVSKSTMNRFNYLLHHKGAFLVFLLFLIPGFPKDYLCYILGLGEISTAEFLILGGGGRLFGTVLLTLGGNYIRLHQYVKLSILVGAAIVVLLIAIAYKDRLERMFRLHHLKNARKRNARLTRNGLRN